MAKTMAMAGVKLHKHRTPYGTTMVSVPEDDSGREMEDLIDLLRRAKRLLDKAGPNIAILDEYPALRREICKAIARHG